MTCPVCGAEDWETVESPIEADLTFCVQCGYADSDELPGDDDFDDFDEDDLCTIEGHDWQEVEIGGEWCDECARCGAIDC